MESHIGGDHFMCKDHSRLCRAGVWTWSAISMKRLNPSITYPVPLERALTGIWRNLKLPSTWFLKASALQTGVEGQGWARFAAALPAEAHKLLSGLINKNLSTEANQFKRTFVSSEIRKDQYQGWQTALEISFFPTSLHSAHSLKHSFISEKKEWSWLIFMQWTLPELHRNSESAFLCTRRLRCFQSGCEFA